MDDQASALAQPVAKLLANRLGRPVAWQLVANSGVNTKESLALLERSELEPADFFVAALGTNDVTSQRAPRQFLQDYRRLVEEVRCRTGAVGLVATGLPPLRILPAAQHPLRWYLGRYAARLDHMLQRWISKDAAARYISLDWAAQPLDMARDRFHPGAGQYRRWAELVSEQIMDLLVKERLSKRTPICHVRPGRPSSSERKHLDGLGRTSTPGRHLEGSTRPAVTWARCPCGADCP